CRPPGPYFLRRFENVEVVTPLTFTHGAPPSGARCFFLRASAATLRAASITAWYLDGRPTPRFGGGGISSRATSTSRSSRFRSVNVILFLWFLVPWFGARSVSGCQDRRQPC